MKKYIIIGLALVSFAFSSPIKLGDKFHSFTLPDQFNKTHIVDNKEYEIIIIAFEKESVFRMQDFLENKEEDFLNTKKTAFILNLNEMSSFEINMFALPELKELLYPILLVYEKNKIFPRQKDALTVLKIKNNEVVEIEFFKEDRNINQIFF